jgi:hypothetical protein
VDGYGGSFVFSILDLCCECLDDPDSLLTSLGTACTYWIGLFSNDCEADVSDIVDVPGSTAGHVCPLTCGSCSAVSLNTTQRTCGLCPAGYQYDAESNTYTDLDECGVSNGGCDPLMGYYDEQNQWVVSPCTNTQGSFSCNSCPGGFEQLGNTCMLPVVVEEATVNTNAQDLQLSRLDDIAAVQPKAVLAINGPEDALNSGSDAEAMFLISVQEDLAASLGTSPSDIVVSNLRRGERRRLQDDALIELNFDVVFVNETNSPALLAEMTSQLADPDSPLMNAASTANLVADQQPIISFVCPVGKVRQDGEVVCRRCPAPSFAKRDGVSCADCPLNQEPTERGDACTCSDGFFNVTAMQPKCFLSDYVDLADLNPEPVCQPCLEYDCIDTCQGSLVVLKPGWAAQALTSSKSLPIFECKEPDACPGGSIGPDNTTLCTQGYSSTLCGSCDYSENYVLKGGQECTQCGSTSVGGVIGIVVGIAVFLLALGKIRIFYNYLSTMQMMNEVVADGKTIAKIVLATFQILGSFATVLGVTFPDGFRQFIEALSSFLRFDVGDIFIQLSLGCLSTGKYYSSLATNWLLVIVVVVIVGMEYIYRERRDANKDVSEDEQRENAKEIFDRIDLDGEGLKPDEIATVVRRIDATVDDTQIQTIFNVADEDGSGIISFEEFYAAISGSPSNTGKAFESEAASEDMIELDLGSIIQKKMLAERHSDALTKVFLLVFLLYPGLTNKIFDGFICRELAQGQSVLEADYELDCTESAGLRYGVNGMLLIIWPIGLPAVLYLWMIRSKPDILSEDPDTLQKFDFVLADYRTDRWYWEVVELGRKLVLSGLIGLFGRGTIAQTFAATLLSFLFFAFSVHMQPYKQPKMNLIKAFTEFQIFGVLLVCIILQTDASGLPISGIGNMDFYGSFQLYLTVAVFPLVLYTVLRQASELRARREDSFADTEGTNFAVLENPIVTEEESGKQLEDWIVAAPAGIQDWQHFEALSKFCSDYAARNTE